MQVEVGKGWRAREVCAQEAISYTHPVATHGHHRPVPPQFGEYRWAEAVYAMFDNVQKTTPSNRL